MTSDVPIRHPGANLELRKEDMLTAIGGAMKLAF